FKLRARSAFLTALSLTAYSEFGLIVAAGVLPEYLVPLAIAVSISFVIAAPLNRFAHPLFDRFEEALCHFERDTIHPDEQPKKMSDADVLIFGMGRTGSAAYRQVEKDGFRPLGLDADTYTAKAHQAEGRNVLFADAEDSNFWRSCDLGKIKAVILAMDDLEAKLVAARSLRQRGFAGPIVAHALQESHQEQIREAGADHTHLTMNQAGISLAEQMTEALNAS
ncbi:MAG: sodium:proton exchanger, partial [Gammaproteobacteria bacterium]|nr:sodium:proton exchanger [Gammaproteobacteria bacterium]